MLQGCGRPACKRRHAAPIKAAMFIERYGQSFGRGFDMLDGTITFQRPALEDRRFFGLAGGLVVAFFQRQQQRRVGIGRKGADGFRASTGSRIRAQSGHRRNSGCAALAVMTSSVSSASWVWNTART